VWDALPRGHKINPPEVLFKKIEDEQVAELAARFGGGGVA
jgi:methionyl-tRNA synthetase